jgi:hypothetical protein
MRNRELLIRRNRAIAEKFYELYDVKRMRIDDALKILSEEVFFLDTKSLYSHIFYNKENLLYYEDLVRTKGKARKSDIGSDHPKLFD